MPQRAPQYKRHRYRKHIANDKPLQRRKRRRLQVRQQGVMRAPCGKQDAPGAGIMSGWSMATPCQRARQASATAPSSPILPFA
ncbi:hypothetical protein [Komagataeibacter oboediens]|uniref:Uncharacterized protein n=1 Tax=Komagataeibacter oboediens TaxID=65958 RepID=A0ABS5SPL0_9PROT|nr:hypothetical protein [Komagataeibacter oboediens]MBL7232182.1 hypothetical protein [Komagataeibacter oboediens]MBT0675775.1 hypothetical protein [Komagataeibacter oboediens]MBT0677825.1 hypothetical protein [Komagataeibacter oboediens]